MAQEGPSMGQEDRMCGAAGPHVWGRRIPSMGQEEPMCGAKELYLWGRRTPPMPQEGPSMGQEDPTCGSGDPPPPHPGGLTQVLAGGEEAGGLFDVVGQ